MAATLYVKVGMTVADDGDDLFARGQVIPISRGVLPRRTPMRVLDESRLFGSPAWEDRQRAIADATHTRYSRERLIKRAYHNLHRMEDTLSRITTRGHTETGLEYSPLATLIFDLRMGIDAMPSAAQRNCWRACVVGEARTVNEDGSWSTIRIPRKTHAAAAAMLDMGSARNVTDAIARATAFVEAFLFNF